MAIPRDKLLDVETQIYLAERSGQLSGPGYDIEALKAAGLVLPDSSSPTGVRPAGLPQIASVPGVPAVSGVSPASTPKVSMPKLDVETQIYLAERSGQLSGPGYDINELKAAGMVVPSKKSSTGVASPPKSPTTTRAASRQRTGFFQTAEAAAEQQAATDAGFIRITQAELDRIATAKAKDTCAATMKAHYTVKTYKVNTKEGVIFVEALNKGSAKSKAEDAGYRVYSLGRWYEWQGEPTIAQPGITPKIITLRGDEIPEEWLRDLSIEEREAMGMVKEGGKPWVIDVVKVGGDQILPKVWFDALPKDHQAVVISQGWDAMVQKFYVEVKDGDTGKTIMFTKEDWGVLDDNYRDIIRNQGYNALVDSLSAEQRDFDAWLNQLKDENPDLYKIHQEQGYDKLVATIKEQNKVYEAFQAKVKAGDIIALPDDTYIARQEFDKLPTGSQQILKEGGFEALEAATTMIWEKERKPTSMGIGSRYKKIFAARIAEWEALPERITHEELKDLSISQRNWYNPAPGYTGRALTMMATPLFPAAKALLPEYTIAEVSATEWLLTAANIALLPVAFGPGALTRAAAVAGTGAKIVRGISIGASGIISGVVGHQTVKHWDELTPTQRGIGIGVTALCAIPMLTTVARNVKIGASPTISTARGNVVAWKGLSVAGHPIIGRSSGKWILGTRSLTLPEARLILDGYHPQMMLETKVFVNKTALAKAGFTRPQIDYLVKTLKARKLFAGKASPWLDKNVLTEPTQRLNSNEINIVMRHIAERSRQVKNAKFLYGSPTIKAQLAPKLRNWRAIHDWDISVTGNQADAEAFTKGLLKALRAKGGGVYRINPKLPMLIEKQIAGKWVHIADIHPYDISSTAIPTSQLDATGQYSYGRMVSETAITINYPGKGKIQIMRLSESGVRKADTILRVRQTPEGTAFRPPARGIAQPGVPKDAADFYVILRTFKGELIAEDWLKAWAKAMGYTDAQLAKVLPKIRQAMLEVAAQTPSDIIGYEFIPAKGAAVSPGASPAISIHTPSSLGASMPPSLAKRISEPVYPYKQSQSPAVQKAVVSAISSMASKSPAKYPSSAKPSPSVPGKPSAKPSPSVPGKPSVSPSLSPKPSPSPSPVPKPSPQPSPSPLPSPSPSPSPSPIPILSPYPSPKPGPKPKPPRTIKIPTPSRKKMPRKGPSLATWKQGIYWISIFPPFRTKGTKPDVVYSRQKPPWGSVIAKGRHAPRKTLRSIGKVPPLIELPMGMTTARVRHGRKLTFSRRKNRKGVLVR